MSLALPAVAAAVLLRVVPGRLIRISTPTEAPPTMKFSDLRDSAAAATADQAAKAEALAAAAQAKQAADVVVNQAVPAFASAIKAKGGEVVDVAARPPVAYRTTDGVAVTRVPLASLDDDLPEPSPGPTDPTPTPAPDPVPASPAADSPAQ